MSYYIAKTVSKPFDATIAEVTAKLKEQGFGLLTDIDVQATLKSKIGADTPTLAYTVVHRIAASDCPASQPRPR